MMTINNAPWRKYFDVMHESVDYVEKRKNGEIKSIKTPWKQFNSIGMNGIEWGKFYSIASRPGVGKSLITGELTRNLLKLNPEEVFSVLNFQFEMLGIDLAAREFSAVSKKGLREILSAHDPDLPPLTDEFITKLRNYAKRQVNRQEYIVDKAMTVSQMSDTIDKFYMAYRKPIIITLDHTLLIKKSASEKTRQETLENMSTAFIEKKNKLPISFIVLTQLNRTIDNADRQKPGNLSNYPTPEDVYGSDFIMQSSDVVLAYNRPAKYHLATYGPEKFIIEPTDKYLIACHRMKDRLGGKEGHIDWYEANYPTMSLLEREAPKRRS